MQSQQVKAIKTNKYTINTIKRVHTRSKSRKATQIKKIHLQTLETRIDYSLVIDLSKDTNKEIKRSMIELDRRSGGEKSLIRRFSPLPSSFFFSPCSFALFLSFSELSGMEWSGISKMERSLALNSLCHDLNSVRRQLCTARTKVVRLGRTRWESAKSGKTRTKPGKGRTRESKNTVSSCILLQSCRKQTNSQQYQILRIYQWNAHDFDNLEREFGTKSSQIIGQIRSDHIAVCNNDTKSMYNLASVIRK